MFPPPPQKKKSWLRPCIHISSVVKQQQCKNIRWKENFKSSTLLLRVSVKRNNCRFIPYFLVKFCRKIVKHYVCIWHNAELCYLSSMNKCVKKLNHCFLDEGPMSWLASEIEGLMSMGILKEGPIDCHPIPKLLNLKFSVIGNTFKLCNNQVSL